MAFTKRFYGVLGLSFCAVGYLLIHPQSSLVVLDMQRAIQEPAERLAHSTLSETMQQKAIKRYTDVLPEVIRKYATAHHATIISAQVLSSHNHTDITQAIILQTLSRIKHEA